MLQLRTVLLTIALLLAACSGPAEQTEAPPPEPRALLREVIDNLRDVETFRMLIEQTGAPYSFAVTLDAGDTTVAATMRRGEAAFQVPDVLFGTMNLRVGQLPPIGVDIFARGSEQWFKLTGGNWIQYPIAEGFNPGELLREDAGFSAALNELQELSYVGAETLVDGTPVHHVRGIASGRIINSLLFYLLALDADVTVDVFIGQENTLPLLLEVTIPDTATEDQPDTVWRLELYDYGAELELPSPGEASDS